MRAVIQRVKHASVTVNEEKVADIGQGMMILLGIEDNDNQEDIEWLCKKITSLRIFDDEDGVMNLPIGTIGGEMLIISQFTLYASTRKGNRPSYIRAAKPEISKPLYEDFCKVIETMTGKKPATGIFGADMKCELLNDGPLTIIIDTKLTE